MRQVFTTGAPGMPLGSSGRVIRPLALSALVVAAACGSNPGNPQWRTVAPRALASVAPPREPARVTLEMFAVPWWTLAESGTTFILAFDEPQRPPVAGKRVGPVRSSDVVLAADELAAVRCAWKIVPMGDARPCTGERAEAMAVAHPIIARAEDDLRAQAARAGLGAVAGVRCFAADSRTPHLWCEGVAVAVDDTVTALPPGEDPTQPIDRDPAVRPSRFVLVADGGVGMLGRQVVVSSTVGLRYRPVELGFYIADLSRHSLAPMEGGRVGVGATALGRYALGRSRWDAIAGGSVVATLTNGATNPAVAGLYEGFAGIAYQTDWRIFGAAQPWIQLRAGAAYDRAGDRAAPLVGLHVGLSTPERR